MVFNYGKIILLSVKLFAWKPVIEIMLKKLMKNYRATLSGGVSEKLID